MREPDLSELEQRMLAAISEQARGTATIPVYPFYLALQPEWRDIRVGPLIRRLLTRTEVAVSFAPLPLLRLPW